MTNAAGRTTEYFYDLNDNVIRTTTERLTADGSIVTDVDERFFDKSNRMRWSIDAEGNRTDFTYDAVGNMTSLTDARGAAARTDFKHDKLNRLVEKTEAAGSPLAALTKTMYHPLGMIEEIIDPLGIRSVTEFDELYFTKSTTVAAGTPDAATTTFEYDTVGNLVSYTDPRGEFYTWTYEYDGVNRRIEESGPSGTPENPKPYTITFDYDKIGNKTRETDKRGGGLEFRFEYDAAGRLRTVFDQLGQETKHNYDAAGNLTESITPALSEDGPAVVTMTYDKLGFRESLSDSLGNTTCFAHNDMGKTLVVVNPRAGLEECGGALAAERFVTRTFFDGLGRPVAMVDAEGYRTELEYDAVGNLLIQRDPRTFDPATPGEFIFEFDYDELNRIKESRTPVGPEGNDIVATEKFVYDKVGNLKRYEDPRGEEYFTEYRYNDRHQLVETRVNAVDAVGEDTVLVTQTEYDAIGNIVRAVDPRGEYYTTTYEYDAGGRLVKTNEPTGSEDEPGPVSTRVVTYDEAGNVVAKQDPRGEYYTTRFTIDDLGRVESISVPRGSEDTPRAPAVTTFSYFPGGTIREELTPRHGETGVSPIVYTYDAAGRMTGMTDSFGAETTYLLDEHGNQLQIDMAASGSTAARSISREYDDLNRITVEMDAEGFETKTFYDSSANVVRIEGPFENEDGLETIEFTYDGRDLLRSMTDPEGNIRTFDYDLVGNRIREGDPRGEWADMIMEYDGANRMILVSRATGSEEEPGDRAVTRMEHDAAGNVIRSIDPRGDEFATTIDYNFRGQPIKITSPDGPEESLIQVVEYFEYDLAGNRIANIDGRGEAYRTVMEVNAQGQPLKVTHPVLSPTGPDTLTESFEYDADGNMTRHVGIGGPEYVTINEYDALGRIRRTVDPENEATDMEYDRYGNLLSVTTVYGTTTSTYDGLNRLRSRTNGEDETTEYNYDDGGLESTIKDPRDHVTTIKYDRMGREIERIDAKGVPEFLEYDEAGNVIRFIDRRGVVSESIYDARNFPLSNTRAVGTDEAITEYSQYDVLGRLVAEIDPRGDYYRTEYVYDAQGRVIEQRGAAGTPTQDGIPSPGYVDQIVETFEYDAVGNLIAMTPARGDFYRTTIDVDGLGRAYKITSQTGTPDEPREVEELFEHNDAGQVVKTTDVLGHVIEREFDKVGRIKRERVVSNESYGDLQQEWQYIDTPGGYRITQTDANGNVMLTTDYDKAERPVTITPRSAESVTQEYDEAGNLFRVIRGGATTEYTHDELNRIVTTSDGQDSTVSYSYDAVGNLLTRRDARESEATSYTYDLLNRQRVIRDPDGGLTSLDYDEAGNLTGVRDPAGNQHNYVYDAMNRMVSDTNEFGTRTFRFDPAENVVEYVDRIGRTVTRTYDGNQRILTETWIEDGNAVGGLEFAYDALGQMTSAINGDSVTTFDFSEDAAGRILGTGITLAEGVDVVTMEYVRDKLGNATDLLVDVGAVENAITEKYTFLESNDRLFSTTQEGALASKKRVEFGYDPESLLYSTVLRFNAEDELVVSTTTQIDALKLVRQIKHSTADDQVINQFDYGFDADYRINSITDLYGVTTYSYDDSGRLTGVESTDPAVPDATYDFDANSNRTSSTEHSEYSYAGDNRLENDGEFSYEYDAEGNVARKVELATGLVTELRWDHRNRLTQVATRNAEGELVESVDLGFDALDRRIWTVTDPDGDGPAPAQWRGYAFNGNDVLFEMADEDGQGNGAPATVDTVYLHGGSGDSPLAQERNGDVHWLLADHLGTVRDIVDATGQLADHISYSPYGNILARTNEAIFNRYFFAGEPWEADIAMYYLRARFYDPATGRFASVDPSGYEGGDPNLYRYAMSDPVNMVDPTGLSAVSALQNPLRLTMESVRRERQDKLLGLEQAMTVGGVNVATFASGVSNDLLTKVGVPLAIAGASGLPVVGPILQGAMFLKGAYDVHKALQKAGDDQLDFWDGVNLGLSTIAGIAFKKMPGAAFLTGTALNVTDVGMTLYYKPQDQDRLIGAFIGFAGDARSARGENLLSRSTSTAAVQQNASRSSEAANTNRMHSVVDGAKQKAFDVMSTANQVYEAVSTAKDTKEAYDKIVNGFNAARKTRDFVVSKYNRARDLADATRFGWNGSQFDDVVNRAAVEVRQRKINPIKKLTDHTPIKGWTDTVEKALKFEQQLANELTSTHWLRTRNTAPMERSTFAKARGALQEFTAELRGEGFTAQVREFGNSIVNYNARHNAHYREMMAMVVRNSIYTTHPDSLLDARSTASLTEQAIMMHASGMLRVDNPAAPTPSKPFTHQMIIKALPDMILRNEMEMINRQYPNIDDARLDYNLLKATVDSGRGDARFARELKMLGNHLKVLGRQEQALDQINLGVGLLKRKFPNHEAAPTRESAFLFAQANALRKIVKEHPHTFDGPWNYVVNRLGNEPINQFEDFLRLPFADREQVQELATIARRINNGKLKAPGIGKGSVVALMLQGTAGATLSQIAYRADFVKQVYSGNFTRGHATLRNEMENWRTLADLMKSPMKSQSDVDLGLIVKGGGKRLLSVFKKSTVKYPNGVTKEMAGGASIQAIVNYAKDKKNSFINEVVNREGLEEPVEWYVYQNRELAKIGSNAQARNTYIAKGGMSVIPNGSSFDLVAHFSPYIDTFNGHPSMVLGGGFLHSAELAAATSEFTVAPQHVGPAVIEALQRWEEAGAAIPDVSIHVQVQPLQGRQLGYVELLEYDDHGLPKQAVVVLDDDAAGHGWYVDAAPYNDDEFLAGNDSSDHSNRIDLLTVVQHEVGHLLGFTQSFDGFAELTQAGAYGREYVGLQDQLLLDPSGNELSYLHRNLLMAGSLAPGIRKSPSQTEASIISQAQETAVRGFSQAFVQGQLSADAGFGFLPLSQAVNAVPISEDGLVNSPAEAPETPGWTVTGTVDFQDGVATLTEGSGMLSDFSQTFLIPDRAGTLSFTVGNIQLNASATAPPDAFEVAILDTETSQSLFSDLELLGSDAFLNLQPNGILALASGVEAQGTFVEGQLDLSQPLDVSVEIPQSYAGKAVTLLFDLIGLDTDNSQISVSNIQFDSSSEGLPSLTAEIPAAFDSGLLGDQVTNISSISVQGQTDPSLTVRIDLNGDGFDDGEVLSGPDGSYEFTSVAIREGSNDIRVRTENAVGSVTESVSITLDTDAPLPILRNPDNRSVVDDDLGYVEVEWQDEAPTQLVAESIDAADIQITGVDVERVEDLGNGRFRYVYGDDGDALPEGIVRVRFPSQAVADTADNASDAFEFTFDFQPTSEEQVVFFGPTPYLSLADTPEGFVASCEVCSYHVEDFEDAELDRFLDIAPGSMIAPDFSSGMSSLTDSVDADDGVIDGTGQTGQGGYSWFADRNHIEIDFSDLVVSAGLTWTDGDIKLRNVQFEAFDQNGISLGIVDGGDLSDDNYQGTTAEDRFFGVRFGDGSSTGISSISITNEGGQGIEIDHVQYVTSSLRGDFDRDGDVDSDDIDLLTEAIRNAAPEQSWDLNQDETLNSQDFDFLITNVLATHVGDTNLDGDVDFHDFLELSGNYGNPGGWADGNFNTDTVVDMEDFLLLSGNFGLGRTASAAAYAPALDRDVNGDGLISVDDVFLIAQFFEQPHNFVSPPTQLDLDGDQVISTRDLSIVLDQLQGLQIAKRPAANANFVDTALLDRVTQEIIGFGQSAEWDASLDEMIDELAEKWQPRRASRWT